MTQDKHAIWKSELDGMRMTNVQKKLDHAGAGHHSVVPGFQCGDIDRGFIEHWIADREREAEDKAREATKLQASTLLWAKIAGVAGIVGVLVTLIFSLLTLWIQK